MQELVCACNSYNKFFMTYFYENLMVIFSSVIHNSK